MAYSLNVLKHVQIIFTYQIVAEFIFFKQPDNHKIK